MQKTRYTVKIDDQSIELDAYGASSAASHALVSLGKTSAFKVTVISGNGERESYKNVSVDDLGFLDYERQK